MPPQTQTFTNVQPIQQTFTDVTPVDTQTPEQPGFFSQAADVVGRQAKAMLGPIGAGYEAYKKGGIGEGLKEFAISSLQHAGDPNGIVGGTIDAVQNYAARRAQGYNPVYSVAAPIAAPMVGVNLQRQEQDASQGNTMGVLAEAAVPATEAAAGYAAHEAIPENAVGIVKDATGRILRQPNGKLTPLVRGAARVGGGLIGSAAGTGGTIIGGLTGPAVADAIIPNHPNPIGWSVKLPGRIPRAYIPGPAGSVVPEVNVVPEPRPLQPGDRPGAMFSVPRGTLPGEAARGTPGAADTLRNIGKTVLFQPSEGTGYPGPREVIRPEDINSQGGVPPGAIPQIELNNASGESSASMEAINRASSERRANVSRVKIDTRSGKETPLIGTDAVDAKAGPYERIVKRQPGKPDQVLDQGEKAKPIKFRQNLNETESMADPDTRFNTARHEAGHAVVSELLRPNSVQGLGLDESGGYTLASPPMGKTSTKQLNPDEIRNLVAVSYAGGMSEPGGTTAKHVGPDQARRADILSGSATTPLSNFARILTGHTFGQDQFLQANEQQAEAKARVNALLADPKTRSMIDSLATMLNVKGTMSGPEVRAFLATGGK
jgi:hypothetical protein